MKRVLFILGYSLFEVLVTLLLLACFGWDSVATVAALLLVRPHTPPLAQLQNA